MSKITVAKTAGFCFGVNRAVQMVHSLVEQGKSVWTLGPIIHNPQTLKELEEKGVRVAANPKDVPSGDTLVIRSHGVARSVLDEINRLGIPCADATCPFVKKIHRIVAEESGKGRVIFIAGDPSHPEVQGIIGHCFGEYFVFENAEAIKKYAENNPESKNKLVSVVAQTTFSVSEWKNSVKILKKVYTNASIFDTICNATANRQSEAVELSHSCSVMVVIGGR